MREMDLLFLEYVNENYDQLDDPASMALLALLDEADLYIMNWVLGRSQPERSDYLPIISRMRVLKNRHMQSN